MFVLGPVLTDQVDGDPGVLETTVVRFRVGSGTLAAPLSSIQSGPNDERPIHDNPQISIAPLHDSMGQGIFCRYVATLGEIGGKIGKPWLDQIGFKL